MIDRYPVDSYNLKNEIKEDILESARKEYENSFTCRIGRIYIELPCDVCNSEQLHRQLLLVNSDYVEENNTTYMDYLFQCTNCKMLCRHIREVDGKLEPEE